MLAVVFYTARRIPMIDLAHIHPMLVHSRWRYCR